jgi:enediyne biosynthesis protein E4
MTTTKTLLGFALVQCIVILAVTPLRQAINPLIGSTGNLGLFRAVPSGTNVFVDRAEDVGINFVHFNGMSGEHYYVEMVGSGAAMFDYDNDGDLDIYIVQGSMLGPGKTQADALFPARDGVPPKGRLFRNDLVVHADGSRTLKFTDVTDQSGIDAHGYGMGVATGDFNNDGWIDLYLTNFGSNQMWRNNGNGTFTDVTEKTGTDDPRWSVSAAFLDFDRDGWLDLYVGNYVNFSFTNRKRCFAYSSAEDYCGPLSFDPVPERLFHNRGDGTFEDVSAKSHIALEADGALGVVCADFNGDGWIDIYVTNDGRPNHLWMNQHDGTFKNEALLAGCALNKDGIAESSMGVDAGDFDNDGDEDLFMTNLNGEKSTLMINNGKGWFEDRSFEVGIAIPSKPYTGFGTAFLDYDNDGWLDLLTVNGEVRTIEALARIGDRYPLSQRKQLFHNLANGKFEEVAGKAGNAFTLSEVGRGAAFGDVDNDGDTDVLIVNNNGRARLLINEVGTENHWLGLRLVGTKGKRDMLGAKVAVFQESGPTLWRRVRTDGSYCSANDPRVLIGLGQSSKVKAIRAFWPSGQVEEWNGIPIDTYTTLREGTGKRVK